VGLPLMKSPLPVPLGEVAGTGEEQRVAGCGSVAEDFAEPGVERAAALTVAPARHDERTGDDPGPAAAGPAHRVEEAGGPVGLPVGQQQFRLRRDGVDDLGTQHTVLAGPPLRIAVVAERLYRHLIGKGAAQVLAVSAETGVEDGDLYATAPKAGGV